jgi:hypothetical protein
MKRSISCRQFGREALDLAEVVSRREASFLGGEELNLDLNDPSACSRGEHPGENTPRVLSSRGRDDIRKDIFRHGREQSAKDVLILINPPVISRVRHEVSAFCRGGWNKLGQGLERPIDKAHELRTSEIREQLRTP